MDDAPGAGEEETVTGAEVVERVAVSLDGMNETRFLFIPAPKACGTEYSSLSEAITFCSRHCAFLRLQRPCVNVEAQKECGVL